LADDPSTVEPFVEPSTASIEPAVSEHPFSSPIIAKSATFDETDTAFVSSAAATKPATSSFLLDRTFVQERGFSFVPPFWHRFAAAASSEPWHSLVLLLPNPRVVLLLLLLVTVLILNSFSSSFSLLPTSSSLLLFSAPTVDLSLGDNSSTLPLEIDDEKKENDQAITTPTAPRCNNDAAMYAITDPAQAFFIGRIQQSKRSPSHLEFHIMPKQKYGCWATCRQGPVCGGDTFFEVLSFFFLSLLFSSRLPIIYRNCLFILTFNLFSILSFFFF
jgi:hypothetical protein